MREIIAVEELVKFICAMLHSKDTQELSVSGEVSKSVIDTIGILVAWQNSATATLHGLYGEKEIATTSVSSLM